MKENKKYLDIRSNGDGVVGRVFEESEEGKINLATFKGGSRKKMMKNFKKVYPTAASVTFARRGKTYF